MRGILLLVIGICLLPVSAGRVTAAAGVQAAGDVRAAAVGAQPDEAAEPADIQTATMMEALDKVNVRTAPDTGADILGQLEQGDKLFAVELTKEGWYRVVYEGETGYVRGDFLKIYSTADWDTSEDANAAGPSGEVIDPEEEVRKAAEEAEMEEETKLSDFQEVSLTPEEAQTKHSKYRIPGIVAGAALLIAGYIVFIIRKERNDLHRQKAGMRRRSGQKEIERQVSRKAAGAPRQTSWQKTAEGEHSENDMEFLDLDE